MTSLRAAAVVLAALLAAPRPALAQSSDVSTYALFGNTRVTVGPRAVVNGGDVGGNGMVSIRPSGTVNAAASLAGDLVRVGAGSDVFGQSWFNVLRFAGANIVGATHYPIALPLLILPPPLTVHPGTPSLSVPRGQFYSLGAGAYSSITTDVGVNLFLTGGAYDVDRLVLRGSPAAPTRLQCNNAPTGCTLRVRSQLSLGANFVGVFGGPITIEFAGTGNVTLGRPGAQVQAIVRAPSARLRLRSSRRGPASFTGSYAAGSIAVGSDATIARGTVVPATCGDGVTQGTGEVCDAPDDVACPGQCQADCNCPGPPPSQAVLHSIGPSVLNNATSFGVQLFGANFAPGAQLQLSDKTTSAVIETLPTNWLSATEMTALVPAGMPITSGIQRDLVARVINPGAPASLPPDIGHCQTDKATSPIACISNADCPANAGACLNGDQRLTMFNNLAFLNPNSAAVVPAPYGVCNNGNPCQGSGDCPGNGACSAKLYVTPQERDELWVYNTGTNQFVDQNGAQAGIQGIPVGDNPFHVEMLTAGGPPRAWVVNRFEDSFSVVDPATDTEIARVTGAALGVPGRLRMETEVEFNRAGTRAYLSNENLDEVQVLDISGAHRDAPVLLGQIDVGVNPRGMATNAADTRLYVANIQSADVSIVDIAPGSPTENQVLKTVAARATDDIVGGRADGWEAFVIGGRAPRGIAFSDAQNALFVTSIGPQTGPRSGPGQTGGAIINPTVTVIDAASEAVVAHVAFDNLNPNLSSCSDPELMALDDARNRLYVTCQGSGTVAVLDTGALAAGTPAEQRIVSLPLPSDVSVPTLSIPSEVGGFGTKSCAAFTASPGVACANDSQCAGCPASVDGIPVVCCAVNNPIGVHNGPRGIAISGDHNQLYVVNQFTTSVATLDVSPVDPALISVASTRSFPGAFGSDSAQSDRRLGQIEFFTDVKKTSVSCATCHIDDHQDGVFFEADVRGPRLRRVLSVRSTREFPPLLQDQLVPDLAAFTDIVVHVERGGAVCVPCIEFTPGNFFCFGDMNGGGCTQTSLLENQQNTAYAKAVTFFPNPNLGDDGSFSTSVPLPGGQSGDARHGADLFDQLACQTCHPEPLFTIDQLRAFEQSSLGQPLRMRDVSTPVFIPLRAKCQDMGRPSGIDGSHGFSVPTLRGTWDTFPLLMSGSAGLAAVGSEPAFTPACTPGTSGCCAELQSPINPSGTPVPEQHLGVTTKDPMREVLTAPLAVPGTGHGAALGLPASDLNALIAYVRSL